MLQQAKAISKLVLEIDPEDATLTQDKIPTFILKGRNLTNI